jgi:hypothetical protein
LEWELQGSVPVVDIITSLKQGFSGFSVDASIVSMDGWLRIK